LPHLSRPAHSDRRPGLTYQELAAYFNAKKNVSLPQIYIRVPKDGDQVQLERSRSRESSLEITFGLKVHVKALRDVDAVINGVKLKSAWKSMRRSTTGSFSTTTARWT
jgi:hypothetical protein